jgi:hypothetical protein
MPCLYRISPGRVDPDPKQSKVKTQDRKQKRFDIFGIKTF